MGMEATGDIMFTIVPLFMIGMILFAVFKGVVEWRSNEQSPKLTVPAIVITKRSNVSHDYQGSDHMHNSSSTTYYVTFQFDSGDRTEFKVTGTQFGMLAENDRGMLTFQGTRYIAFDRQTSTPA